MKGKEKEMLTAMWIMFALGAFAGTSVTLIMVRQLRLARQDQQRQDAGELYRMKMRLEWAQRELAVRDTDEVRRRAQAAYQAGYMQGTAEARQRQQAAAYVVQ
jgi:uncharacterized membrane-anchored protein YhcB (DUF1043 family)